MRCGGRRVGTRMLWAIDRKGGIEISPGRRAGAWFADGDPRFMFGPLENAAAFMQRRGWYF